MTNIMMDLVSAWLEDHQPPLTINEWLVNLPQNGHNWEVERISNNYLELSYEECGSPGRRKKMNFILFVKYKDGIFSYDLSVNRDKYGNYTVGVP